MALSAKISASQQRASARTERGSASARSAWSPRASSSAIAATPAAAAPPPGGRGGGGGGGQRRSGEGARAGRRGQPPGPGWRRAARQHRAGDGERAAAFLAPRTLPERADERHRQQQRKGRGARQ